MYRSARQSHRWIGIFAAAFLLLVSGTGFLLANKGRWAWMRPPVVRGGAGGPQVGVAQAVASGVALGHAELRSMKDVDRVDYRPKSNIYKVITRTGYREIQVDAQSGKVLSDTIRNDQLAEDVHDLSLFGDLAHDFLLPAVAVALFGLGATGITLFFTPVIRRWRFRRQPPPSR